MDFFAHQHRYRRRSFWLTVLFVLAVLSAVAVVDAVVAGIYHLFAFWVMAGQDHMSGSAIAKFSALQLVLIGAASCYRLVTLRAGGSVVALGMGATPVPVATTQPARRRLRHVVEEIAIASGVPVFNVFVMENEPGINAFAAGYTTSDAAICVTRGCLEKLTRDELQGVIAHEFSHVVHGDMRLNMRLMGLLYGIVGIGVIGHVMLDASTTMAAGRRGRGADNSLPALMLLGGLMAVTYGSAGSLCGRLVQAAVARTRESLADVSAVQYTRQVSGIAGALKKIAALREGARIGACGKGEVAHMLFGAPDRLAGWFATHPPLRKRLQALGVAWNEAEIQALAQAWQHPGRARDPASAEASLAGFAPDVAHERRQGDVSRTLPVALADPGSGLSRHVGHWHRDHFDMAADIRERLPAALRQAAEDPQQATGLLLALVIDRDAGVRQKQKAIIEQACGAAGLAQTEQAWMRLDGLDAMARLPLAALVFPVLRRRPRPQLEQLLATLGTLARADEHIDLGEYCLLHLLTQQLHDLLDPAAGFRPGGKRLRDRRDSFATLCAIVATQGNPGDCVAARRAYMLALARTLPGWQADYQVPANWQARMREALDALDRLRAPDKQLVIDGLGVAVSADGKVTVAESELLRMICAALHCPLPLLRARPASVA